MKHFRTLFLFALIFFPALSIFYKVNIKDISFIPMAASDQWTVEFVYDLKKIAEDEKKTLLSLPLISSWQHQKVEIKKILTPHRYNLSPGFGGRSIEIIPKDDDIKKMGQLTVNALVSKPMETPGLQMRSKIFTDRDELRRKYLMRLEMTEDDEKTLEKLNQQIVSKSDDSLEAVRKIYYYITEEVPRSSGTNELSEVLSLRQGSDWGRSLLFTYLARMNKVPARINTTYKLSSELAKGQIGELKRSYFPEVLLGEYWYPIDLITNTFMRVPDNHLIIFQDSELIRSQFNLKNIQISIAPVMINKVDSKAYKSTLSGVSKILSYLSLHSLPLAQQSTFYIVLLIPVGTLLLSFSRNIIGVSSFGIFTPILLSLFFIETSFLLGLVFFMVIVLIGFAQRFILDKFYLLAVPRLSILLTLVIIVYLIFSLVFHQEFFMGAGQGALNYFPIVIITIFIERFSVNFIEEGFTSTLKTLLGTLFISIFCYLIFRSEVLRLTLFNHPEILFSVVGLNFIIGSYKGYRISELTRFQELTKENHVP